VSYFGPDYANETWVVPAPGKGVPVMGNSNAGGIYTSGAPVADAHGIWFPVQINQPYGPSASGFVLYVAGHGLYWVSNLSAQLGGGCVTA
jgi:hypothetical protein